MAEFNNHSFDEDEQQDEQATFNPYPEYDGVTLIEAGQLMYRVRQDLDAAKEVATALEKRYDWICTRIIPPLLESSGLKNFRLSEEFGGKGVRVQDELYTSLRQDNFPEMKSWLEERMEEGIIKETINASTLKAWLKKRLEKGLEYPAHLVTVTVSAKARFF